MTALPAACPNCGYSLLAPPAPPVVPPPMQPAMQPAVRPAVQPAPSPQPHDPAPAPSPRQPRGVRAASVPQILLGLGAICLLVAAVIFLAVAWSWLGVGGRTGVLVCLTLVTGAAGHWCGRRGLPVAAEALTAVSLGVLVLDVVGAHEAGWLGTGSLNVLVAMVGGALLSYSLCLCAGRFKPVVPQLAAPAGLALLALGIASETGHPQLTAGAAVLGFVALAVAGIGLRAAVLPWTATIATFFAWCVFGLIALADAAEHPSLDGLWVDGHGYGLVAASALVFLALALPKTGNALAQLVAAFAASTLTFVAALPGLDEGATRVGLVAIAATVGWSVAAALTPRGWYAVPRVPLAGAALVLGAVLAGLAGQAALALGSVAPVFDADAGVRLDPADPVAAPFLLPIGVAALVLAAALALPRTPVVAWTSGAVLVTAGVLTLALYPTPLWCFVAAVEVAAAGLLVLGLRRVDRAGLALACVATVLGAVALLLALPSAVLTTVVLATAVVGLSATLVRRFRDVEPVAGVLLPLALAGLLWSAGSVADVPYPHRSLAVLAVVGLLALALPRIEIEVSSWAVMLVSITLGVPAAADESVSLAVHLTLAGALVTASALVHPDRRLLGWAGGALLAGATWVRLADLGVEAPEPYTLPSAAALLLVGLDRLRRDNRADSARALGPGLVLATVPSLLWVLTEPISLRAALLGGACFVLVLGGAQLRWGAPVVIGSIVGSLVVLRELAPYAAETPQWVLIGLAGALLIGVGVTWESRVRDLQQTAGYLGRLR